MNSQTGFIGYAVQSGKGVHATPNFFTKYASDDIGAESEPIIPSPEVGGGRDLTDVYPGPIKVTGGQEFDVRSNFVGLPLYLVAGAINSSMIESGVYQHTITPANTIPWFSAQKQISDTYDVFDYTDLKMNSLTGSCDAGGQLVMSLDIKGITESGSATPVTPAYGIEEVLMWHSAEIKIEGTTICLKSINFEHNNNLIDDDLRICPDFGRGLGDIPEKRREFNATLGVQPDDNALYEKAVYGEAGATTPKKKVYSGSFYMKYESVNVITGVHKYYLEYTVPKAFFIPFKPSVSGDDPISHELALRAVKDGSSDIFTIVVQNATASYTA